MSEQNPSFDIIYNELNLDETREWNEAELLLLISERVAWFLENDKDLLLSYLYRLDIDMKKITEVLSQTGGEAAHIALGKLILERQKQRVATREKYRVDPIEGWEY
jgi:hypothetical protein